MVPTPARHMERTLDHDPFSGFLGRNARGRLGVIKAVMVIFEGDRLVARALAEFHAIARGFGIQRFRLLRKLHTADAILLRLRVRGGVDARPDTRVHSPGDRRARRSRRRRGFGLAGS
jgi:hypothetical protein